jgi:hypothetical protein
VQQAVVLRDATDNKDMHTNKRKIDMTNYRQILKCNSCVYYGEEQERFSDKISQINDAFSETWLAPLRYYDNV